MRPFFNPSGCALEICPGIPTGYFLGNYSIVSSEISPKVLLGISQIVSSSMYPATPSVIFPGALSGIPSDIFSGTLLEDPSDILEIFFDVVFFPRFCTVFYSFINTYRCFFCDLCNRFLTESLLL